MNDQPVICAECGLAGHASSGCDHRRARLAREARARRDAAIVRNDARLELLGVHSL